MPLVLPTDITTDAKSTDLHRLMLYFSVTIAFIIKSQSIWWDISRGKIQWCNPSRGGLRVRGKTMSNLNLYPVTLL